MLWAFPWCARCASWVIGVIGMMRAGPGVDRLRELGTSAAIVDAFDRQAVRDAIAAATPDMVIDQPTSLPSMP